MKLRGLVARWKGGSEAAPAAAVPAEAARGPVALPPQADRSPAEKPAGEKPPNEKPDSEKLTGPQTVLVTVLGLEGQALAEIVQTVIAECRRTHTRPLFVTDGTDFAPLRAQRALFEQVIDPDICRHRRPGLDWHAYALEQYRLIGRKWKPVTTIAFGRPVDPDALAAVVEGRREKL
ncbi:MAG TPA: hypothetical protein VNS22_22960 [Geminicoccus sp.]|uniref:hypothetical protein n=1 Tax=Geminicoccus sp. TaxID=2024832 RepID=UPI002B8F658B|nr:hypothetical protein [Geminicoccus sp.]HWL71219.1 hypothetical protein [Geminicoccus sp.]